MSKPHRQNDEARILVEKQPSGSLPDRHVAYVKERMNKCKQSAKECNSPLDKYRHVYEPENDICIITHQHGDFSYSNGT